MSFDFGGGPVAALFLKTHIKGYTKKDGAFVAPHEDKRAAKSEQPAMMSYSELARIVEESSSDYSKFGIRVMTGGDVADVGDELEPSSVWEDGAPTDEKLEGASALDLHVDGFGEFDESHFDKVMKIAKDYDWSNQVVLLGSKGNGYEGNDPGEVVMENPIVVAIIKDNSLTKAHIKGYTKKDGTFVAPHEDKRSVRLYHGGPGKVEEIHDGGIYGGVFASADEDAARSHGDVLHTIDLDESEILTQEDMKFRVDEDIADSVLNRWLEIENDDDLEVARAIVLEDESAWNFDDDDVLRIFDAEDIGHASWEGQKVRGRLAQRLGYKAVEMDDEHGKSYLVLPGTDIKIIGDDKRAAAKPDAPTWGAEAAQKIAEIMDADEDFSDFGLRVIPEGHPVNIGDKLENSYQWNDGEKTDEELDGVSTIGVSSRNIDQAMHDLDSGGYAGDQVALVKGERSQSGEDPGEVLIRDAEVAFVWHRPYRMAKASPDDWTPPTPAQADAGNYKKPRVRWNGLEIAIENPAGSVREDTQHTPPRWRTKMKNDYGYVCRSGGVDGDEVDVYLGPDLDTAPMVYVVHQRRAGDWDKFDEDKVMIGFPSEAAAREAYLLHYDDPRFLGPVTAMPVNEFKEKVRATYEKPAMIKGVIIFLKAHVRSHQRRLPSGKVITVDPYETKVQKRGSGEGQMDMFAAADEHGEVPPAKVVFTRKPGEKPASEGKAKKFYVTMIRDGKPKPALLAGPFDTHDEALSHVEPARKKAHEVDPWSEFDAFGTSGLTAEKHPPGVLNDHLGIGAKEKSDNKATPAKESSKKVDDYSKKINNVGESEKNSIGGAMSYTKEQLDYIEDVLDQHVGLWGPKDHAEFQKMWAERKKTPQPLRDKSLSARNEAKALGGKALKGSRKQKEWAEKIRAEKLKGMAEQQAAMAVDPNGLLSHSKFWIENRDKSGRMIGEFVEKQKGLLARHKETSDSDERKKIADEYNALTAEWGFE